MKNEVTLRQFRYFIAAATTGQFSTAALSEHVSQSAITSAVQSLERRLKLRLFDRLPHGVALTPEGQVFFHHALHVMDAVNDALNHATLKPQAMQGTIRLAATYTVLGYFLPDLLSRYKRSYPNVEIDLIDMDRCTLEKAVREGSVDLGVGLTSNLENREDLKVSTLVRSRRRVWVSAGHPLTRQTSATLEEIAQYPYIVLQIDDAEAAALRHWPDGGKGLKIAMRTASLEALRGLVAYGFGVSILSDLVYRPWSLEGKRIVALPVSDVLEPMEVGLLWSARKEPSTVTDTFRQFLIQACEGTDTHSTAA
ncbi:MAG TPA: LysR family transcriptional regulator [Burkholderiaceae bacterium]|nr:LysR family transcriptional regulator [Burkholderiaceae bacterium]